MASRARAALLPRRARARLAPRRAHAPIITPRTAARRPTLCTHTHRSIDVIASTRPVAVRARVRSSSQTKRARARASTSTTTPRTPEPNRTKRTGDVSPRRAPSLPRPRSRALPARRSRRPVCAVRFPASRGARRFNARLDRASARSRSRTASSRRTRDPRGVLSDAGDDARARRGAAPPRASGYKPSRHDPAIDSSHGEYEVGFLYGCMCGKSYGCESTGRVVVGIASFPRSANVLSRGRRRRGRRVVDVVVVVVVVVVVERSSADSGRRKEARRRPEAFGFDSDLDLDWIGIFSLSRVGAIA